MGARKEGGVQQAVNKLHQKLVKKGNTMKKSPKDRVMTLSSFLAIEAVILLNC